MKNTKTYKVHYATGKLLMPKTIRYTFKRNATTTATTTTTTTTTTNNNNNNNNIIIINNRIYIAPYGRSFILVFFHNSFTKLQINRLNDGKVSALRSPKSVSRLGFNY